MDTLVICLGSHMQKRCQPVLKNLQAFGNQFGNHLSVSVLPAVTPKDFDDSSIHPFALETIDFKQRTLHAQLSHRNQVGCALSHIKCWQRCAKNDEPLLVLEDDCLIEDNTLLDFLQSDLARKNACDFVSLVCGKFNNRTVPNPESPVFRILKALQGTAAYCIHPRGARKLLEHALPVMMHVDHYMGTCIQTKQLQAFQHRHAAKSSDLDSTLKHVWIAPIIRNNIPALALGATSCILFILLVVCLSKLNKKINLSM